MYKRQALLTVIGFSVHDTIVVFDRVRENLKYYSKKMTFGEIMNASINQTLARSINTSLTTLITLLALYLDVYKRQVFRRVNA